MKLLEVPFRRWPLLQHVWLALAIAAALVAAGLWILQTLQHDFVAQQTHLKRLKLQQIQDSKAPPPTPTELFEKSLPPSQTAESVARDIAAFGSTLNVQISAIQIENQVATANEYAAVQFQVSAKGEYRQTKLWIAELLGRYATLAVKTLSMQAPPQDPSKQDVRMTLVLYVRS